MSAGQARDALAAFERLQSFYQSTGRRVSLLAAVSEFAEAAGKLDGRSLGEAVQGYLRTEASVKRKDLKEAVEEFIRAEEHARKPAKDSGRKSAASITTTGPSCWPVRGDISKHCRLRPDKGVSGYLHCLAWRSEIQVQESQRGDFS